MPAIALSTDLIVVTAPKVFFADRISRGLVRATVDVSAQLPHDTIRRMCCENAEIKQTSDKSNVYNTSA